MLSGSKVSYKHKSREFFVKAASACSNKQKFETVYTLVQRIKQDIATFMIRFMIINDANDI